MANTLLNARGIAIGSSYYESMAQGDIAYLARYIDSGILVLPIDAICLRPNVQQDRSDGVDANDLIEICDIDSIPNDAQILDIGPKTIELLVGLIGGCHSLIWNGPLGMFEDDRFANGTKSMIWYTESATKDSGLLSVIGGGDTLSSISKFGCTIKDFTYGSTAGGAFLSWLEDNSLPGILALERG